MGDWCVIALIGLVTLATRVGGAAMAGRMPQTAAWRRFMQHLPATLLVAIAAPAFLTGDAALTLAAATTLLAAAAGASLPASMAVGVAAVAALRLLL